MFPYVGGKSKIGKWIFDQMPKDHKWNRYTEVFGGAFWVYLKRDIKAKEYHYNDFNPFLYNLWRCVTEVRDEFINSIEPLKANDKEFFKNTKKEIESLENTKDEWISTVPNIDIARKYIYLLTNSFSGVIGGGMRLTVDQLSPFKKRIKDKEFVKKLDKITKIHNMDFLDLIDKLDCENGFFYIDPPYVGKEWLYCFHNYNLERNKQLANKLRTIKSHWLLSYYDEPFVRELFPEDEFIWVRKEFARSASPIEGKGDKGVEVLIYSKEFENFKKELKLKEKKKFEETMSCFFTNE